MTMKVLAIMPLVAIFTILPVWGDDEEDIENVFEMCVTNVTAGIKVTNGQVELSLRPGLDYDTLAGGEFEFRIMGSNEYDDDPESFLEDWDEIDGTSFCNYRYFRLMANYGEAGQEDDWEPVPAIIDYWLDYEENVFVYEAGILAKVNLTDDEWDDITGESIGDYRFFKIVLRPCYRPL